MKLPEEEHLDDELTPDDVAQEPIGIHYIRVIKGHRVVCAIHTDPPISIHTVRNRIVGACPGCNQTAVFTISRRGIKSWSVGEQ